MSHTTNVHKLYLSVIDDVIGNVKEMCLDEGVDETVLLELRQLWVSKLMQSKAVADGEQDPYASTPSSAYQAQAQAHGQKHQTIMPQGATGGARLPTIITPSGGRIEMSQAATTATLALPQGYANQFQLLQQVQGEGGQPQYILQTQAAQPGQLIGGAGSQTVIGSHLQQAQRGTAPQHVVYTTLPSGMQNTSAIQPGQIQTTHGIIQLDGANDSSSEDDEFDDGDNDDDDENENHDEENEYQGEEEDPLNSADDISEGDPSEVFDTDNVVVCQYDKINRCKNKWKFHLKDGIMSLKGKDYVFSKSTGDAEW